MKLSCKRLLLITAMLGCVVLSHPPTEVLGAEIEEQGARTSLSIVPLAEEQPRLYEVTDLQFGEQTLTDSQHKHPALNDLAVKILDSRQHPTSWALQLKIGDFRNAEQVPLKAEVAMGTGQFTGNKIDDALMANSVSTLTDDYQTIIRSSNKKDYGWIIYTVPKEQITLSYGTEAVAGDYTATISWRLVNADL